MAHGVELFGQAARISATREIFIGSVLGLLAGGVWKVRALISALMDDNTLEEKPKLREEKWRLEYIKI